MRFSVFLIAGLVIGTAAEAATSTVPTARPTPPAGPTSAPAPQASTRGGSCFAQLSRITDAKRTRSPKARLRACRIRQPVRLSTISTNDGPVSLTGNPVVACELALSLAQWTRNVAAPAAKRHVKRRLTALRTGPGFQCRRRNRRKGGKLSEHGLGNAIDIMGFRFADEGKRKGFAVRGRLPRRFKKFQREVRKAACGPFTTTLGPGSDRYHGDHLHFDHGRMYRNGKRRAKPPLVCR